MKTMIDATQSKHLLIMPHLESNTPAFKSEVNGFTYPAPNVSLRYSLMSNGDRSNNSHGAAGFNELGVDMTATETIYNSAKVLNIDPYVAKDINEDAIVNVILSRIHSAKEGAQLLGSIIEKQGTVVGFGVAFMDNNEIWYVETASGHQWMAERLPKDTYFVSANESRLTTFNPTNTEDFLASKNLIAYAIDHHLYNEKKDGAFNFHTVYVGDTKNDITYNYPRVYTLQHQYTANPPTKLDQGKDFPIFLKPTRKLTIQDVKKGLRNHYNGTQHDPYLHANPREAYRPIAVFRTQHSHILQSRANMPGEIGHVEYLAWGMTTLSVYLPFYQGATSVPESFSVGTAHHADDNSANWKFRKLQALAMVNYNKYAPIVQKAYHDFEHKTAIEQVKLEKNYMATYKSDPDKARKMIQAFEEKTFKDALILTDALTNELFTKLTEDIDTKYKFEGA